MKAFLLADVLGENIFTRNAISSLFDRLEDEEEKQITLDFKDVKFISRSCADEYLKRKNQFRQKLLEVNMSKEVLAMLEIVKDQYKSSIFNKVIAA